ncbi:MAG: thioredoxin family protein [Clostridiaceae bacterium]
MINIKVLGSGCAKCKKLEEIARKTSAEMGLQTNITKVTDYAEIIKYNVLTTPALVINEKVVSTGRIPDASEIHAWLEEA